MSHAHGGTMTSRGSHFRRFRARTAAAVVTVLTAGLLLALPSVASAAGCTGNAIVCENQETGTPASTWDIEGIGDGTIQGYSTQISANLGETVQFKIDTVARSYRIEIYRLGFYGGDGARKVADVTPSATLPQNQPVCATDPNTEIYDCGTWGVSASWAVPATAVSGVYIARLIRTDNGGNGDRAGSGSHIPFIVRNDASRSDLLFQTSDTTWQAYNPYGQSDFYQGQANGRAFKLSYNRPFITRGTTEDRSYLFSNEFPMIKFLESNGYDVSYISGLDTDTRGSLLTNHKTFLSVGHDEYWSTTQRQNVERARDAGVNLAFFSGNEVYWKTRWEPSQDGSGTANRTLVCYKSTWADADIDPAGATATWRDPRFGDNPMGPENSLTGTMYMSNDTDLALTVTAAEGKTRLWRNTALTGLAAGTSQALAPHTVGYESDEDIDNGFRPAGLIRMSTTTGPAPEYLQDFGKTTKPGTTTHHVTMYKAASGARVFSAGTIQWSWGLDTYHDGVVSPVDARIQQATINILADMDARPSTVINGLTASTKTQDGAGPTATISTPADNSTLPQGSQVTVSGTATDAGGGVVAGIEVSVDGGATWHPATGTTNWTYTGVLTGDGAQAIRVRAIDDSGNIQSNPTDRAVDTTCPCSIFGAAVPTVPAADDSGATALGTRFTTSAGGFVSGIRFYKGPGNTGTHVGTLYKADGSQLATATFANETDSGWQTVTFPTAVAISPGTTYIAAYTAPAGRYAADGQYFAFGGVTSGALTALGSYSNPNGVFGGVSSVPQQSFKQTNYYVDPMFSTVDTTPLTAGSVTPLNGASSVSAAVTPTAVFSRSVVPSSIAMTVTGPSNTAVTGTVGYDAGTNKVTFTPQSLEFATRYTVSLQASAPDVGPMASPLTWSFTTVAAGQSPGVCPCTVFADADAPSAGPISDDPVELGMAFTAATDGTISGIRFYKDATNSGPHTVTLRDSAGAPLGTATTGTESTSGWQQADFASPLAVNARTTYIVSYRTSTGRYSYTPGGLAAGLTVGPLSTPVKAGRYGYGSSLPVQESQTNYFVDPVFTPSPEAPPAVAAVDPANNSTSVPVGSSITATFVAPVQRSSVSVVVTDPAGAVVAGAVSGDTLGNAMVFTPSSALAEGTRYKVAVSGAKSAGGVGMTAPAISYFTTTGTDLCPCSVLASAAVPAVSDSGDAGAITVGLRFRPAVDGLITGIRVQLDAANTGTHTGALYSLDGVKLAELVFPANAGPGWQTASFGTPYAVTAGTTYVAAAFAPVGHYSATSGFYAGPYANGPLTGLAGAYTYGSDTYPASASTANYYVDVQFTTDTSGAPSVNSRTPAAGATSVPLAAPVTADFDRPVLPGSILFTLAGPGQATVPGTVAVDAATNRATFTPASALAVGTTYTASVKATGTGGGAMASPVTWTFTTVAAPVPAVSGRTPAAGAVGVEPAVGVTGTFSTPIDQSSLAFTLTGPGGTAVPGAVTYNPTSSVAAFQPTAALALNTQYTATLSAVGTAGGVMAAPATWSFTTAAPELPTVSGQSPAAGATAVALASPVTGTFSIAVDPSSVALTLVGPNGTAVAGVPSYNATTRTATLQPSAALAYNTTYTASLRATGTTGGAMASPVTWTFTTAAAPVPTVSAQTPAPAASGVATGVNVTGTFDIPITASTLAFTLTGPNGAVVPAAVTYNATTRVATLDPTAAALANNTVYTASLSATSAAGGAMAAPVTWTFTTVALPAPALAAQSPAANATTVALASNVTGTFSIPINVATLAFTLTGPGGVVVTAPPATYNTTTRVATLNPSADLAYGTVYTVSLKADSSAGGVMAAPATWSFTTVAAPAPTVDTLTPANGATSVAAAAAVSGRFSVAITPATLQFTVTPAGGTAVAGTVGYNVTSRVATFQPSTKLAYGTVYTASLRGTSTLGGVMAAPVSWSFTTVPAATLYSLFSASDTPSTISNSSSAPATVGVQFYSDVAGTVTAVKFYAGPLNTGPQPVSIYTTAGVKIGSGTSTATGSGWRTVTLTSPVAITANTNYIATYTAPVGRYSSTSLGFLFGRNAGVLHTRSAAGAFRAGTAFPAAGDYTNYWVDIVLSVPSP